MKKKQSQFEETILPLQPIMQRMAEHLLGNEDDAADMVQDCFVILWKERDNLVKVVNPEAYCVTLVKRRCVDLLRRRRPTIDIKLLEGQADEVYVENERQKEAVAMINKLPGRQALAINLRHFKDADTKTIAQTMGITEGNVYTLLSRAYSTLKHMILDHEKN